MCDLSTHFNAKYGHYKENQKYDVIKANNSYHNIFPFFFTKKKMTEQNLQNKTLLSYKINKDM